MYFVFCPRCLGEVPIPKDAVNNPFLDWTWECCPYCGKDFTFQESDILRYDSPPEWMND
jgi:hypothetical protein